MTRIALRPVLRIIFDGLIIPAADLNDRLDKFR